MITTIDMTMGIIIMRAMPVLPNLSQLVLPLRSSSRHITVQRKKEKAAVDRRILHAASK
jgi:hypothetical protein